MFEALDPSVTSLGVTSSANSHLVLQRAWFAKHHWLEYLSSDGKYLRCRYCFRSHPQQAQIKVPETAREVNSLKKHQQSRLHSSAKRNYSLTSNGKCFQGSASCEKPETSASYVTDGVKLERVESSDETGTGLDTEKWSDCFLRVAEQLRRDNVFCDAQLIVTDRHGNKAVLRAHKLVLACCSQYLKARLGNSVLNVKVQLDDLGIQIEGLEGVLDFLYGGDILHLTKQQAAGCLHVAKQLQIPCAELAFQRHLDSMPCDSEKIGEESLTSCEMMDTEAEGIPGDCDGEILSCNQAVSNGLLPHENTSGNVSKPSVKPALQMYTCGKVTMVVRKRRKDKPMSSCSICGEHFTKKVLLTRHVRKVHSDTLEAQLDKKYKCPTCNRMFARAYKLTEHMRVHTGDRPHLCQQCGKTFTGRDNLLQHVKTHDSQERRRHQCDKCDMAYYNHTALVNHVKAKHSGGQRLHVCDYCGKAFAWAQVLKNHVLRHQPPEAKRFKCTQCHWSFHTGDHLKRHMRTHDKSQGKLKAKPPGKQGQRERHTTPASSSRVKQHKEELTDVTEGLEAEQIGPQYHSLTNVTSQESIQLEGDGGGIAGSHPAVGVAQADIAFNWQYQYLNSSDSAGYHS